VFERDTVLCLTFVMWKIFTRSSTFVEVVYTKSVSKMTTREDKTEMQPRHKNLPYQISVTVTGYTVVILWHRPSQTKRQRLTANRSEIPHLKDILSKLSISLIISVIAFPVE